MAERLRLMAILAHPDDESLGIGGTLAHYAREGIETFLVTATRGERGRYFTDEDRPSDEEVGRVRERELREAARELGVRDVALLDYVDRDLDRADPAEVIARIIARIREVRPQVVVTFDPFGAYGHPDHIAISQFAAAAVTTSADPTFRAAGGLGPHTVSKLYYTVNDRRAWEGYTRAFKRLVSTVDGVEREAIPWPDWSITTRLDTRPIWQTVWRAVRCHRTQMAIYSGLDALPEEDLKSLWGVQTFYRVFSTVNGGRALETDLFAGLLER